MKTTLLIILDPRFWILVFLWGCVISLTTPECPPPIPVKDARIASTPADTVTITLGCPYISIDLNGDSTFVDYGRLIE